MIARLVPVAALTAKDRRRMLDLFVRYFEGVTEERFVADLAAKNQALLLEDADGTLLGFSTLLYYRMTVAPEARRGRTAAPAARSGRTAAPAARSGRTVPPAARSGTTVGADGTDVVYSGDTIVDPAAWNASLLAPAWIASVRRLHREHGGDRAGRPLLWLLITSGYRTYRFLPAFWRVFYPCHLRATPPDVRRTLDELAAERFGRQYDPATGVVRFDEPQVLRPSLRGIPPARRRSPHVDFFARANPGHERGDELVCLTEIADDNLTSAGRRMVARGRSIPLRGR